MVRCTKKYWPELNKISWHFKCEWICHLLTSFSTKLSKSECLRHLLRTSGTKAFLFQEIFRMFRLKIRFHLQEFYRMLNLKKSLKTEAEFLVETCWYKLKISILLKFEKIPEDGSIILSRNMLVPEIVTRWRGHSLFC